MMKLEHSLLVICSFYQLQENQSKKSKASTQEPKKSVLKFLSNTNLQSFDIVAYILSAGTVSATYDCTYVHIIMIRRKNILVTLL